MHFLLNQIHLAWIVELLIETIMQPLTELHLKFGVISYFARLKSSYKFRQASFRDRDF